MPERNHFRRFFALLVLCCVATATSAAKSIGPFNGATGFTANAGTTLADIRAAVKDDLGNPLPGETVHATGCGYYVYPDATGAIGGPNAYVVSDANGVVTLPPLTLYYANGTCPLTLEFADRFSGSSFTLTGQLTGPIATQVKFVSSQDQQTTYGGTLSSLQVAILDAAGNGIAGQTVQAYDPCGTFAAPWDPALVVTDSAGVATLPTWTANPVGGYAGCAMTVRLAVAHFSLTVNFRITLVEPPPPPVATRVVATGPLNFTLHPNESTTFSVMTVDNASNPVPNQPVFVTSETAMVGCGRFAPAFGFNAHFTSDSSGNVAITYQAPNFTAPCKIIVKLESAIYDSSIVYDALITPVPVATHLGVVNHNNDWTIAAGSVLDTIRLAALGAGEVRIPNAPVTIESVTAGCGSFAGGATQVNVISDQQGEVAVPAWTAANVSASCVLDARLFGNQGSSIPLNITVTGGTPPPPPPPPQYTPGTISLMGYPGERFLNGRSVTITNEHGQIKPVLQPGNTVYFSYDPTLTLPEWNVVLAPAPGSPLVPGDYTNAGKPGTPGQPGLAVWGGSVNGCQVINGRFIVREVEITDGQLIKFAADIGQFCDGEAAPLVAGIRWNSSIPYTPMIPTPAGPPTPPTPSPPVRTTASRSLPSGGTISLSIAGSSTCTLADALFLHQSYTEYTIPFPPVSYPYGQIDFKTQDCGAAQLVAFTVEVPGPLPPTAQWWKYGPTPDDRTPHWYVIPSTVNGNRITFEIVDGGLGDDDLVANGSIRDLGMIAIPGGALQDLWWSGAAENGWGISIVQHRDVLFANVFAYDAQGAPTWYVMPSGSWDASHTVYTGQLFLPKGAPYFGYDVSRFDIGAPVGTARFTFSGTEQASFDYTIDGVTGQKNLTRVGFGPRGAPSANPVGDLWWAGAAQNGWGIAFLQQFSTIFGLWYTYDANGKATWFVMPTINLTGRDEYRGTIYRPQGPPWLGTTYDMSRHRLDEVGTFHLTFANGGATFEYSVEGRSGSIPLTRIPF